MVTVSFDRRWLLLPLAGASTLLLLFALFVAGANVSSGGCDPAGCDAATAYNAAQDAQSRADLAVTLAVWGNAVGFVTTVIVCMTAWPKRGEKGFLAAAAERV